jgi:hypothetical protein
MKNLISATLIIIIMAFVMLSVAKAGPLQKKQPGLMRQGT